MPRQMNEKIKFLDAELTGLRARMSAHANAAQSHKLEMLEEIRNDYQQSIDRAAAREVEA